MPETTRWRPTHRLLAQHVRVLGKDDDRYLVEHADGSIGWVEGWPYSAVLVSVETVEREALNV